MFPTEIIFSSEKWGKSQKVCIKKERDKIPPLSSLKVAKFLGF